MTIQLGSEVIPLGISLICMALFIKIAISETREGGWLCGISSFIAFFVLGFVSLLSWLIYMALVK